MNTVRNQVGVAGLFVWLIGMLTIFPASAESVLNPNGSLDWIVGIIVLMMEGFSLFALLSMVINHGERFFAFMATAAWIVILATAVVNGFNDPTSPISLTPMQIGSLVCGLLVIPAIVCEDLRDGWK